MSSPFSYPLPPGVHPIPPSELDLRPDSEIDFILHNPPPVTSDKNIWLFWASGLPTLPPHHLRTVRTYHRRFARAGWTVRLLDRAPSSPLNIAHWLDASDASLFPAAFSQGTLGGRYAAQHTSDLVRWPLLLTYGGAYVDVGLMPIGDLDALWNATIGDPTSPIEVLAYDGGDPPASSPPHRTLTNYFLAAKRHNAFFARCHALFLRLWAARTSTDGMSADPLLRAVPHMDAGALSFTDEEGRVHGPAEVGVLLSDYIAQGQVMSLVLGLVDAEGGEGAEGWDGPRYAAERVYALEFMAGAQLVNELTAWDGRRAFELLSLSLPRSDEGEEEGGDQAKAREIVEQCLARSFAFKLATGLITRVMGDTLGSLWRAHPGADDVPGTYAAWLRHGMLFWCPDRLPARVERGVVGPLKVGGLLEE
ncbi:hypothetical protein DENSPDRAFT_279719 [Dentipellis sp. KUC8613]|nr:hypothetical protein DENSPDRAFT_279719 [Dentipellis sp. KUC8613]